MTSGTFEPLLGAPVLWVVALVALLIAAVYLAARARRPAAWAALVLRLLAVIGIVLPGWAIAGWYRDLQRARELTRSIPVDTAPIAERFVLNSVALLSFGFLVLVAGIYLARRAGRPASGRAAPDRRGGGA